MNKLGKIKYIVVHHSAGPQSETIEQIRKFHTDPPPKGRGWADIAYHKLINHLGKVFQGRPDDEIGAHALGVNQISMGVCCIGNYQIEIPSEKLVESLVQVLATLCKRHNVEVDNIISHSDVYNHVTKHGTSTSCCGTNLYKLLPEIRAKVQKYL